MISAGRSLRLSGPRTLALMWPSISPRLPSATLHALHDDRCPGAAMPPDASAADARRWLNAHLHCLHLKEGTLALHSVAVERDGLAVLLLGGYGAGKSLTGLALAQRGWRVLAGDTTLINVRELAARRGGAEVIGGTAAYLVRREAVSRWLPALRLPAGALSKVDLAPMLALEGAAVASERMRRPLACAVVVHVDGYAVRRAAASAPLDDRAAASVLYQASSHLLDRVPERGGPFRTLETHALARLRLRLVRAMAAQVPVWSVCNTSMGIAARIAEEFMPMRIPRPEEIPDAL